MVNPATSSMALENVPEWEQWEVKKRKKTESWDPEVHCPLMVEQWHSFIFEAAFIQEHNNWHEQFPLDITTLFLLLFPSHIFS